MAQPGLGGSEVHLAKMGALTGWPKPPAAVDQYVPPLVSLPGLM